MHEVTLHELNELHDNAALSGPLRLRLYSRSPRFITRYQALRAQLAHLGIADDEHTHEDQPAAQEEHSVPGITLYFFITYKLILIRFAYDRICD